MKKIRLLDIAVISLFIALGVFLTAKNLFHTGAKVHVRADNTEYEYSAKADGIYKVQGAIGITTFEIKDGRIRIIDSPCPNKICVHQGWDSPLVCLPNNVIITLENDREDLDALSE